MRFTGKVVLITGGGDGIGAATALLLSSEGATVAIADIDSWRISSVIQTILGNGNTALGIQADVLDVQQVRELVETVISQYGKIDILINNVGGSSVISPPHKGIGDLTHNEWKQTLDFNLSGTFLCSKAVLPFMKTAKYGRIVNLSSILARGDSDKGNIAYVTAKAALRAFTRRLARELISTGITCNAVAPGVTLTNRIARLRAEVQQSGVAPSIHDTLQPLATPLDQAKVIAFLASDDAGFISGETIDVTGGL